MYGNRLLSAKFNGDSGTEVFHSQLTIVEFDHQQLIPGDVRIIQMLSRKFALGPSAKFEWPRRMPMFTTLIGTGDSDMDHGNRRWTLDGVPPHTSLEQARGMPDFKLNPRQKSGP